MYVFTLAIEDAGKAYDKWVDFKEKMELEFKNEKSTYRFIESNIYVGKTAPRKQKYETTQCHCSVNDACGPQSQCWNRLALVECNVETCPAGTKCQNRRFQKKEWVESVPIQTSSKGWGLKAKVDIKAGDFVIEYVGDVIDEEECKHRLKKYDDQDVSHFYILTLDKHRFVYIISFLNYLNSKN